MLVVASTSLQAATVSRTSTPKSYRNAEPVRLYPHITLGGTGTRVPQASPTSHSPQDRGGTASPSKQPFLHVQPQFGPFLLFTKHSSHAGSACRISLSALPDAKKFHNVLEIKIVITKSRCFLKTLMVIVGFTTRSFPSKKIHLHSVDAESEGAAQVNNQPAENGHGRTNLRRTANLGALGG